MSASAILSVMMGGALNGASAADTSVFGQDGAVATDDAKAMGAEFSALLAPEDISDEATNAAQDAASAADAATNIVFMTPAPVVAPVVATVSAIMLAQSADVPADDQEPSLEATSVTDGEPADKPLQAAPAAQLDIALPKDDTETPVATNEVADIAALPVSAPVATAQAQPSLGAQLTARPAELGLTQLAMQQVAEDADSAQQDNISEPTADAADADAKLTTEVSQSSLRAAHAAVQAAQQQTAAPAQPLLRKLMAQTGTDAATRIDIEPAQANASEAQVKLADASSTNTATQLATAASDQAVTVAADATADPAAEPMTATADIAAQAQDQAATDLAQNSRLSTATVRTTAELAAHFVQKLGQRTTRFDMVLTPENLGMVDVSLEVGNDGQLQARMVFDSASSANELRARAEELRRQLNEAGFHVAENALEFTDRDSQSRGSFQQFFSDDRPGRRAFAGANRLAETADAPVTPVWTSVTLTPRGVDMKV